MKIIFLTILLSQASFAESPSVCKNLWKIPKGWQLQRAYESQTLCAYNIKHIKKGGTAQWIVSKYKNTSVYAGSLENLGLKEPCIHDHWLNEIISCPDDTGKSYFKTIAAAKNETIKEIDIK